MTAPSKHHAAIKGTTRLVGEVEPDENRHFLRNYGAEFLSPIIAQIYEYIRQHPGSSTVAIAAAVGTRRGNMDGYLATMESHGLLVYEEYNQKFKRVVLYAYEREAE